MDKIHHTLSPLKGRYSKAILINNFVYGFCTPLKGTGICRMIKPCHRMFNIKKSFVSF